MTALYQSLLVQDLVGLCLLAAVLMFLVIAGAARTQRKRVRR